MPVTKADQQRLKACLGTTKLGAGENEKKAKDFLSIGQRQIRQIICTVA